MNWQYNIHSKGKSDTKYLLSTIIHDTSLSQSFDSYRDTNELANGLCVCLCDSFGFLHFSDIEEIVMHINLYEAPVTIR